MSNWNFFRLRMNIKGEIVGNPPLFLWGNTDDQGVNREIFLRDVNNDTARTLIVSVDYKMVLNSFSTNTVSLDNVINSSPGNPNDVLNFTSFNQTISVDHSISLNGAGGTQLIRLLRTVRTPVEFNKKVKLETTITACADNFDSTTHNFYINNRQVLATSISTTGATTSGGATSPYTTRFFGASPNIQNTSLAPSVGQKVWTDSLGTNLFNGGNLWYKDDNFTGLVYRINSSGEVTERIN